MANTANHTAVKDALALPFWRFALLCFRDQLRFSNLFGHWRRAEESEPRRRIRLAMVAATLAEKILDVEPEERDKVVARALLLAGITEGGTFSS